jgi:hypothetical protein
MGTLKPEREHPTKLTDEQFAQCWKVAEAFLKKSGSIRNRLRPSDRFLQSCRGRETCCPLGFGKRNALCVAGWATKGKAMNHPEAQRLATIYERKLASLEALKKSLLHQAFTGDL